MTIHRTATLGVLLQLGFCSAALRAQTPPITLAIDATDAPRKVLHGRISMPVKPGPLTLLYPKWIPGEHGPTGPLVNLTGLKLTAGGKPVVWRRDPDEMYAIHCDVPAGAGTLEASYDFLFSGQTEGLSGGP